MRDKIRDALREFIRRYADIPEDDLDFTDDVDLFDYGYVDSLGATEIVLFAEDRFHVSITQEDITLYPMNSIDEIAEVVERKLSGA